jgi:predicted SprT family Zn-dependent metalloprotease
MQDVIYSFWVIVGVLAVVLLPIVFLLTYLAMSKRRRIDRYWRSLPTFVQYTMKHQGCVSAQGTQCARCTSRDIHDRGMSTAADKRRRFICGHCGKTLYRGEA